MIDQIIDTTDQDMANAGHVITDAVPHLQTRLGEGATRAFVITGDEDGHFELKSFGQFSPVEIRNIAFHMMKTLREVVEAIERGERTHEGGLKQ